MALLDELFATLQGGQTPWAQEAMRRMLTGEGLGAIDAELAAKQRQPAAPKVQMRRDVAPPSADVRDPVPSADPFRIGPAVIAGTSEDLSARPSNSAAGGIMAPALPDTAPARTAVPGPSVRPTQVAPAPDLSPSPLSAIGKVIGGPLGDLLGSGDKQRMRELTYRAVLDAGGSEANARIAAADPRVFVSMIPHLTGGKGTDEMREYQFDIGQRRAKGETDLPTFGQWKADLKKAGAQNISIDQRGENAFAQNIGKAQAERVEGFMKGADAARNQVANLEAAQAAIDEYNKGSFFGTGKIGEGEAALRGYARAIGVGNADTLGAAELVKSTQNQMALLMRNPDAGMGMPGALSDADREFLRAAQPGLDKSPEGNRRMIEIQKRLAQRKIEIASMAERYAMQNKSLAGFEDVIGNHYRDKPLFADLAQQRASAPAASGEPARPGAGRGFRVLEVR